jgi:hypothetical protein
MMNLGDAHSTKVIGVLSAKKKLFYCASEDGNIENISLSFIQAIVRKYHMNAMQE